MSSFDYIDNLGKAMLYSFEVIDDLLPHIYDTPRTVRIIGEDEQEKIIQINQPIQDQQTGEWVTVTDLDGKYDLAMTIGPSFTTQRMETAEAMLNLSNDPSPMGMLAKYGFIKSLDAPGMEEISKGARKMLVGQGLLDPEDGEQPPQQPGPNPKDVADAKLKEAQAFSTTMTGQKTQVETDILQHQAPMKHLEQAAKAEQSVIGAYTASPETPYFGPPQADQPMQGS